jgi:hypothetical protein
MDEASDSLREGRQRPGDREREKRNIDERPKMQRDRER